MVPTSHDTIVSELLALEEGTRLTLERSLELRQPRIRVDAYATFREGVIKASTLGKQTWKVKPAAEGLRDRRNTRHNS